MSYSCTKWILVVMSSFQRNVCNLHAKPSVSSVDQSLRGVLSCVGLINPLHALTSVWFVRQAEFKKKQEQKNNFALTPVSPDAKAILSFHSPETAPTRSWKSSWMIPLTHSRQEDPKGSFSSTKESVAEEPKPGTRQQSHISFYNVGIG